MAEPSALVVCYFVDPEMDPAIRAALGAEPCVVAYDDAAGEPIAATLARTREILGVDDFDDIALVGCAAGCVEGVRGRLVAGPRPAAVIAIDGISASVPPSRWEIDVWRALAARAVRRELLFVATYTDQEGAAGARADEQRQEAPAHEVLERVFGCALPQGAQIRQGGLYVRSHAEVEGDARARAAAQRAVLIDALSRHLAPWLAGPSNDQDPLGSSAVYATSPETPAALRQWRAQAV